MTVDVWADSVQTAAVVVGAAALAYAGRQARLARHGGGGANVLQLWSFLQGEGARANRRALYRAYERAGLFEASEMNWSEDELDAAGHVAQVWSVTGRLVKEDLVPGRLVLEEWGGTIRRNWALTLPVIERERERRDNPKLFSGFEWLAHEAREHANRVGV